MAEHVQLGELYAHAPMPHPLHLVFRLLGGILEGKPVSESDPEVCEVHKLIEPEQEAVGALVHSRPREGPIERLGAVMGI